MGASLAVALRGTRLSHRAGRGHRAGFSVAQPSFDERTTALGNASRRVFEALGVWAAMAPDAAPIAAIHVSDAGRFGFARLAASELGLAALGYVVPNRVLGRELWRALQARAQRDALHAQRVRAVQSARRWRERSSLEADAGTTQIEARLVVAADGAQSLVRKAAGLSALRR